MKMMLKKYMDRIARSVNSFYEKYPYPSLPIRNEHDIVGKLHHNIMANILKTAGLETASLSGKTILDAGCGTGEKSCYFSYHGASVTAIDMSKSSLLSAKELAGKFSLHVKFNHCDIADLKPETKFDHIFCIGVLHHTGDPYMRFRMLAGSLRPGGTITVGLYHRYGRLGHRMRRMKMHLLAGDDIDRRLAYVEKNIFGRKLKSEHERAFVADKFANPYESYHTVEQVRKWFKRNDITYIGSYPPVDKGRAGAFFTRLKWLRERKGFFIVSGKKN